MAGGELSKEELLRNLQRMKEAVADLRSMARQDPAETYLAALRLTNIFNNANNNAKADIEEFISVIKSFADQTDLLAVLKNMGPGLGSVLHCAARARKYAILWVVIKSVGEHLIDARDEWGNTSLHMVATSWGSTEAAEVLIRRARDLPNVGDKNLLRIKNQQGNTALHEAMINCHAMLVHYLLKEDLEPVYWKNAAHRSPLYTAFKMNDSKLQEALLLRPLEPSRVEGLPPLHGAIGYATGNNKDDLFKLILKKNMDELFAMTDSGGGNVFHWAAFYNKVWVFEFLKPQVKYLVQKWDKNGYLPIHIASKMGHVKIIEKLKGLPWRLNKRGQTILHVAAKYGNASVVKYILRDSELRKELNAIDCDGNTALHLAAIYSQPAVLIHLLRSEEIQITYNNKCLTAFEIAQGPMIMGYANRQQLAFLALACSLGRKVPLVSTGLLSRWPNKELGVNVDLLLLRPEVRDKEYASLVRSHKDMPDRNIVKDYINSRMVVATLVATVTFAAGFAVPGGFNSSDTASKVDRGMATMLDKRMFQAFAICNTIAMFCSMTVVVNLIWVQLTDVNIAVAALERTTLPLKIALPAMSIAFLTGVALTAGKLPWLANTLLYLGLLFLLIILGVKLLEHPPFFMIHYATTRRLTFWLIQAYIYLWGVETYIYDDAEDNRMAKETDDSAKANCGDAPHPPSQ